MQMIFQRYFTVWYRLSLPATDSENSAKDAWFDGPRRAAVRLATSAFLLMTVFSHFGSAQSPAPASGRDSGGLAVTRLRVDNTVNPLGIDRLNPQLSWQLASSKRGAEQTAYEIEVASSKNSLQAGKADAWDTGRVASSSQSRNYAGAALRSGGQYYWRVRAWDATGRVSKWSSTSTWEMGLLNASDWADARWIRVDGISTSEAAYAGHYLRQSFTVAGKVKSARLYLSATGMMRHCKNQYVPQACRVAAGLVTAHINGARIGDRQLDPAPTLQTRALYATYDVTANIRRGSNIIGLVIAGDSDVIARLAFETADGGTQSIVTGNNWSTHHSAVTKADRFAGVEYDARMDLPGWDAPEYAENADWVPVIDSTDKVSPITLSSSASLPPMRIVKRWEPAKITETTPGAYTVDFGQNISGRVHIRLAGSPGQVVRIVHSEKLTKQNEADPKGTGFNGLQTDAYTFGDKSPADWSAEFAYYGFRYATITGLKSAPRQQEVWAEQVNNDLEATGTFVSSDDLINKIHVGSVQTTLNNAHGIPEDCPHREKRGWSADGYVSAPQAFTNFETKGFYEKWLQDLRDSQRESGAITDIAPAEISYMKKDGDSTWGLVGVELPWELYERTGDLDVLRSSYSSMTRFIDWAAGQATDYTLTQGTFGGDWVAAKKTHDPLLRTAFWYMAVQHLVESARLLEKQADVQKYAALADNIRKSFNAKFLDPVTGAYGEPGKQAATMTQASLALPLVVGLVPADVRSAVIKQFTNYIVNVSKYHPESGLNATRYVLEALQVIGRPDLFHTMTTQTTSPSWGYMVNTGPGTIWENWTGGSLNHAWAGVIDAYFYKLYGGINAATPGFKISLIRPYIPDNMTFARASEETPYGRISSEWRKQAGALQLDVTIPVGTIARVIVPTRDGSTVSLTVDGQTVKDLSAVRGVKHIAQGADSITYEVVSGGYRFQVTGY
jgi:alpha-L-rhamnosidase